MKKCCEWIRKNEESLFAWTFVALIAVVVFLAVLVLGCRNSSSGGGSGSVAPPVPGQPPAAPTNLAFDVVQCNGDGLPSWVDITLLWSWDDNSLDEDGFVLAWGDGSSSGTINAAADIPMASHQIHLDTLSQFQYKVMAFNGAGASDWTPLFDLTINDPGIYCP